MLQSKFSYSKSYIKTAVAQGSNQPTYPPMNATNDLIHWKLRPYDKLSGGTEGSFYRPHTHMCPVWARRHLTTSIKFSNTTNDIQRVNMSGNICDCIVDQN